MTSPITWLFGKTDTTITTSDTKPIKSSSSESLDTKLTEWQWSKLIADYLSTQPEFAVSVGRERQLWDKTRVDILTDKYACEIDWDYKWAECVGQALWYADNFRRTPCCILLWDGKTYNYLYRCKVLCTKYNIALWIVDTSKNTIDQSGVAQPLQRAKDA